MEDASFRSALADLAAARYRRIAAMIDRLHDAGYPIDGDAVIAQAETGSIGRPHVARALIAIGVVETVSEAFDRFLKPGRPGWVPREPFTPEQAVGLLADHGVLPVLAHPFSTGDVAGVLDKQGALLTDLTPADIGRLREDGTISGGMIPKLETCVQAVEGGCEAAVVLDGRVAHALLIEFFTSRGAGTLVRAA
jgi:hypothetical protein